MSEYLLFTDGIQSATPNTEVVQVQPIIASDTDGSNQAEFFGDAAQEADIKQRIDEIFAQANVQVDWLSERTWNNTNINVGSGGGERPTSDLEYVTDTGDATPNIGHTNALVLDMYFMERVPGFEDVGEDSANGLAFLGQNGIAAHVGDNLVSFPAGRAVIARVMAHEIAHNLGLDHVHIEDNLMDDGTELTPSQIQTVLSSSYTQA